MRTLLTLLLALPLWIVPSCATLDGTETFIPDHTAAVLAATAAGLEASSESASPELAELLNDAAAVSRTAGEVLQAYAIGEASDQTALAWLDAALRAGDAIVRYFERAEPGEHQDARDVLTVAQVAVHSAMSYLEQTNPPSK